MTRRVLAVESTALLAIYCMTYATTIEHISEDGLSRSEWRYYNLKNLEMTLDWIIHQSRPSKRHGWRTVKKWERIMRRDCTMEREESPQWVKDEVRRRINDAIEFR